MSTYRGADGAELHYDIVGTGCPVLVLPGGAPRDPEYIGTLAGLDADHELIVPHLRGAGRSPLTEGPAGSWWHESADIELLRQHLGLDRLTVIAHSSGTRLAISYAAHHAERLDAFVLVTPPAHYLVDTPSDLAAIAARRTDPAFAAANARLGDSFETQQQFERWSADTAPAGYAHWGERERAHAAVGAQKLAALQSYFSIQPPADLPERLRAVTAPVLVIAGREDALTGVDQAVALAGLFAAGTATVLDDCGHYPWVEQPEAFTAAVRRFIDVL